MVDAKGGGMPPAPADTNDQPTLRVVRLYKPRLDSKRVLPSCNVSEVDANVRGGHGVCVGDVGQEDFALSSSLKLPDSFGNIYLGETFTAYISVLNHLSATVLVNASLSAKLQSPGGRAELNDRRMARGASVSRPNPAPLLGPSENVDMIVEHTLRELGTHTLRVTVKYDVAGAPQGSEPRTMRKFYRFAVMNPVGMTYVCNSVKGNPFVQLELRNTTQMDLLLESCHFIPEKEVVASLVGGTAGSVPTATATVSGRPPAAVTSRRREDGSGDGHDGDGERGGGKTVAPMRRAERNYPWWRKTELVEGEEEEEDGEGGGIERDGSPGVRALTAVERYDGRVLLCPEESFQMMYAVRAAPAIASVPSPGGFQAGREAGGGREEQKFEDGSHTLGQVEVCWRTTMGESGSVRSAPVVFEAPVKPEVEVTVDGLPDALQLGRVAECVATVRNRSGRPMTLQLQFRTDAMVGVYVHGQSFRNLGELAPGAYVRCPLQLLALVAGLHELRGCTIADMHTAQEFPQGKLRDILVEFPYDQEEKEGNLGVGEGGKGGLVECACSLG